MAVRPRRSHRRDQDWAFDTVASPDLWGDPAVNSGGGAWYPPVSRSSAANRVYWGTANPAPFPGTSQYPNGTSRPGANLYTDSTVALDLRTGHLIWYHQATAHDIFDRDFVHTMIVDIPGSSPRQVIVGTGKSGKVLGLDPASGRLLWRTPSACITTGNFRPLGPHRSSSRHLRRRAHSSGIGRRHRAYVATLNAPDTLYPTRPRTSAASSGHSRVTSLPSTPPRAGSLWDTKVPGDPTGGATVVNDLVLTATYQGTLVAINRSSGRIVWEHAAPGLRERVDVDLGQPRGHPGRRHARPRSWPCAFRAEHVPPPVGDGASDPTGLPPAFHVVMTVRGCATSCPVREVVSRVEREDESESGQQGAHVSRQLNRPGRRVGSDLRGNR